MTEQAEDQKLKSESDDTFSAGADKRTLDDAPHYSADDVRAGEIILRTRTRRLVFIGGLVGIVLFVLLVQLAGYW